MSFLGRSSAEFCTPSELIPPTGRNGNALAETRLLGSLGSGERELVVGRVFFFLCVTSLMVNCLDSSGDCEVLMFYVIVFFFCVCVFLYLSLLWCSDLNKVGHFLVVSKGFNASPDSTKRTLGVSMLLLHMLECFYFLWGQKCRQFVAPGRLAAT